MSHDVDASLADDLPLDNRWGFDTGENMPGGQHYVDMVEELRSLQDMVVCCDPSAQQADHARQLIAQARDVLAPSEVMPGQQFSGLRGDVSGRGHPLIVPMEITSWDGEGAAARVRFSRFYLGGGVAAHGGAIALAFDDILGRIGNAGAPSRTAYLTINCRKVCPVERVLDIRGEVTRRDGRKIYISGELRDDDSVVADAEGLWVILRDDATPQERGQAD